MLRRKIAIAACLLAATARAQPDDALSARARAVLRQVVATDHSFVKVHAAEVLIAYGEAGAMRRIFALEAPAAAASPYRVGIWRVLAVTAPTPADRARWVAKIAALAVRPGDPDRLRSLESLGKLRVRLSGEALATTRRLAAEAPPSDASLPLWVLQLAGEPGALGRLAGLLSARDVVARQRAAYALRWLRPGGPEVLRQLANAADAEPPGTPAEPFLDSAALALNADPARAPVWQARLERLAVGSSADARYEASQALMPSCTAATLPLIAGLLDDPDANTRVGAAWTILYARSHGITSPR
jgi:SSS family solute:Na+ symporter